MDARLTKMVNELSEELSLLTVKFIEKKFDIKEKLSFCISVLTSAHITSMFSLMRFCSQDEDSQAKTEHFINIMMNAMNSIDGVSHELVTVNKDKS